MIHMNHNNSSFIIYKKSDCEKSSLVCLSQESGVASSQEEKKQEKEAQPAKINGKIVFSDLRNPPQIFAPLFGEVENGRTLTEKQRTQEPPRRESCTLRASKHLAKCMQ